MKKINVLLANENLSDQKKTASDFRIYFDMKSFMQKRLCEMNATKEDFNQNGGHIIW